MRSKATVITYGCQMNKRDSEILSGLLAEMGYELTKDLEDSDLILINTCCVRENADKRIYGRIGSLKRLKDKNSELIMGVCGCLAQKDKEFMARRAPHIDLVLGTFGFSQLPHLIEKIKRDRQQIVACWDKEEGEPLESISRREDDLKAWVSIVYGCNNFCSYCIVPYVRGRERSRPQKAIIREVEELADKGYKEITLLGQNVNSYRRDLEGKPAFADLLYSLNEIEGVERFRFTTAHPRDVPDKLIYAMRDLPKVCEHFHLPLQSGSDPILKAMNRGYTTSYYRELVDRIRKEIPDVGLTTDLIVGFPGETEEQF